MDRLVTIKQDKRNKVEAELIDQDGERILFCKSKLKTAKEQSMKQRFLRTSRTDLDEKQIWSIYTLLTNIEDAFRSLKSELELRPIRHHKESRSDTHLFIGVLAYHLLNTIQTKLRKNDIHIQWWRVRQFLAIHVRITTSMTTREGKRIHIRKSTQPELFHRHVYQALGLTPFPLKAAQYEE